jgi:hypothetical protein
MSLPAVVGIIALAWLVERSSLPEGWQVTLSVLLAFALVWAVWP